MEISSEENYNFLPLVLLREQIKIKDFLIELKSIVSLKWLKDIHKGRKFHTRTHTHTGKMSQPITIGK